MFWLMSMKNIIQRDYGINKVKYIKLNPWLISFFYGRSYILENGGRYKNYKPLAYIQYIGDTTMFIVCENNEE